MSNASDITVRNELLQLGQELSDLKTTETNLNRRIREALHRVQGTGMPVTEAAELLGLHRTTLYRAYGMTRGRSRSRP